MQVRLKPCVLNNPLDPKHATIPSNTFMPGKDGAAPRDISSLYGLVRLLHRQHHELFAALPKRDGFVLQDPHRSNEYNSPLEYVIPNRSDDFCVPSLLCNLQVGELAPSRRQFHTCHAPNAAGSCHVADDVDPVALSPVRNRNRDFSPMSSTPGQRPTRRTPRALD